MTSLRCVYLGWKQPAIRAAAEYLVDRFGQSSLVDLTQVTVALPTRRAGRRLREVLLEVTDARQLALFPPTITTVSNLPELLYEQKREFATPLAQLLTWTHALKHASKAVRETIVPRAPHDQADPRWFELGAMLQRQHMELASHRLDFAEVAVLGRRVEGFTDHARWTALAKLQASYLEVLDSLQLWDRPTARNFAVDHHECRIEGDLVLVGAVDLSRTLQAMVGQVADQTSALIYADANLADRFDEYGCVDPLGWQNAPIDVGDHQILVADGPSNQADAVVGAIDSLAGKYAADEITIGVPDVSLVPHLENKLKHFQLDARWGPGRALASSRPAQWLRIVAEYLTAQRYEAFAELMRHSDTLQFLATGGYPRDAVRELDRYCETHLPDSIRAHDAAGQLPRSAALLLDLLSPLQGLNQSTAAWSDALRGVLVRLYEQRQLNVDRPADRATLLAIDQLQLAMEKLAALPGTLAPEVSAATTILMLLSQMDQEEVASAAEENAIEMVGWLDLPLDDAKVAIVTNMNDGIVPKSVSSDVFLPNALRQELGLDDNAARYARDAYALLVLLESRMVVRLIVGRRQASNDPLRPSRLLMATPWDKLAARCLRLFDGKTDFEPLIPPVEHDHLQLTVPRPAPLEAPLESLSVSDFASYLACPYRFYLRTVNRLRTAEDRQAEIDARTFGDLAHQVLEDFGKGEFSDSGDVDDIRLYLLQRLAVRTRARFGKHPKPTVQVQLAQLKLRLIAFAEQQAAWRQQGWKIIRTEFAEDEGQLLVDSKPIRLKGRIDRIDHRLVEGEDHYAILDYKTGDAGDAPEKKHVPGLKRGAAISREHWADLQLPLYRHLLQSMDELQGGNIWLGYILLPASVGDVRFALANWTADDLQTADEAVWDVVRKIRREEFWPPAEPYAYKHNDDFAQIVQHGIFGRAPLAEEAIGA